MKRTFALILASLAAHLGAYGVSPSRADQGGQAQPGGFSQQPFQLQPAPQPSNNLMNPGQPQPVGIPQATVDQTKQIEENIKTYKPDDWAKAWEHIHLQDAEKFSKDPTVLFADARAKVEYDQGHIPGAIPLPQGEFEKYFQMYKSRILKARKIVTYCHGIGCKLSDKVAKELYEGKKLHNVAAFFGGWPQWSEAHLPVETGDTASTSQRSQMTPKKK